MAKTLKTDYGQEEAAGIWGADPGIYETTIKEVLTENGHITKVRTAASPLWYGRSPKDAPAPKRWMLI